MTIRPIKTPFTPYINPGSCFEIKNFVPKVDTIADAAARKVVITTMTVSLVNESSLPGLNPNHPTHSKTIASVNHP